MGCDQRDSRRARPEYCHPMHAIIFDLDNCLAPADEPGEQLLAPVFDAVRLANDGALTAVALDAAFRDCWVHAFDWVAARHNFTQRMRDAGWAAFREVEVRQPMCGYGDLDLLPSLGGVRFLVTSGFRRLQESKVRALGVAGSFAEVIVDAMDEPDRRGKERIFADLIRAQSLRRAEVLVVGDNAESELAAAKRLSLPSAQILRRGVVPAPEVTTRVQDLADLRRWLEQHD
jgi:FMN phosphatase YigB (HAD superfamily)